MNVRVNWVRDNSANLLTLAIDLANPRNLSGIEGYRTTLLSLDLDLKGAGEPANPRPGFEGRGRPLLFLEST